MHLVMSVLGECEMYDAGNMTNHSQNPTKIAYCVMCKSNAVMSEEVTLDSARYVKGVALVGRGQGFCTAESQAESYQQCECDCVTSPSCKIITGLKIFTTL